MLTGQSSCQETPHLRAPDLWHPLCLTMQNVTANEPHNVLLLHC